MDINKFTESSQAALASAQSMAMESGNPQIEAEHLLKALVLQEDGLCGRLLRRLEIDVKSFEEDLEAAIGSIPRVSGPGFETGKLYISPELQQILAKAEKEAGRMGDEYVSVEHLLLELSDADRHSRIGRLFGKYGVTRDRLLSALTSVRGHQRVTGPNPEATYEALSRYGRDLVNEARNDRLDPVIGRDEEIRRIIRILSRRTKNNPVLI
ncbi:MAG TPA: type VI secretion system ATPase TssH, partial [Bacteroidetes bacterium]|nr:type VI secretion system ATPase TssH [Bacteroidota bacterium]